MSKREVMTQAAAADTGTATWKTSEGAVSEEVRAFVQRRVAGFFLLLAAIFAMFTLWRAVVIVIEEEPMGIALDYLPYQGGAVGMFAAAWLYLRRGAPGLSVVQLVELAALVSGLALAVVMALSLPYRARPDYILLLIFIYVLVVRAIYVPSTAQQTLVLGVVMGIVLVPATYLMSVGGHDPADYTDRSDPLTLMSPEAFAARIAIVMSLWWIGAVAVATATSRVIYGLRAQVRDARRLGQYTLHEKLGQGGMGLVYRASHAMLRRPTAVKLLPPDKLGEDSVARFEREVQLTALLTHPNTVRVFDYGRTPDRIFYYAMELLEGANLEEAIQIGGPMPPGRVIHILAQCAGALAEAHGIGLIHRDIKPANILLTEQGGVADVAKVVDFGLVKEVAGGGPSGLGPLEALTHADSFAGTPHYMSPEAITSPQEIDGRSDVYALGAVGYYLATGKDVFSGKTIIEVCSHHLASAPIPPSLRLGRDLPVDLERVIMSCLAKARDERPAGARELRAALLACADAGAWTEEEARAWWKEHRVGVKARRDQPETGASTIAVDLDARDVTAPTLPAPPVTSGPA